MVQKIVCFSSLPEEPLIQEVQYRDGNKASRLRPDDYDANNIHRGLVHRHVDTADNNGEIEASEYYLLSNQRDNACCRSCQNLSFAG